MSPTVGRIVIYNSGSIGLAAIVTKVHGTSPELVNLTLFNEDGSTSPRTSVKEGPSEYQWSWPVLVKSQPKTER